MKKVDSIKFYLVGKNMDLMYEPIEYKVEIEE